MKQQKLKLVVVVLVALLSLNANAVDEIDGIYYILDAETKTATVTGRGNYTGDITIPTSVEKNGINYSVTEIIGFSDCRYLTSVTIPSSVTSIGNAAFKGCSSLTSITIPSSVSSIGNEVFRDCISLTSVIIPNSITSIGDGAFNGCSNLTSIIIPNSVTNLGYAVFSGTAWFNNQDDGLIYINSIAYKYKGTMSENTNITIKEGTTSICKRAFNGCSNLTSVTIPNSVTSINEGSFYGCI